MKCILLVATMAALVALNQTQCMETKNELHEEDAAMILMKKTWELRGRITQLSKSLNVQSTSDCKTAQKLAELNANLDALARLTSEAQYLQFTLQNMLATGNRSLAHVRNEIETLEKQRDRYFAYMASPHDMMTIAKL